MAFSPLVGMAVQPMVTIETRFRSRFTLSGRFGRSRGWANAMVSTLDVFSIDASAEVTRATDAVFRAYMRTTVDGLGVAGAHGTLTLRRGGQELSPSPYEVPQDDLYGDGWMALAIPGEDIEGRGYYTWVFIAYAPGGGQARAEGRFRFE